MEGLADFLDALLGGVDLVFFSMAVGSLFWFAVIVQPWEGQRDQNRLIVDRGINLLVAGSFALAAVQLLKLAVKSLLIAETIDSWPFPAFSDTVQFKAGSLRILFALVLGVYSTQVLRKQAQSGKNWLVAGILSIPLVVAGAWLVHGAGRFDNRELLMASTVLHQLGAAIWIGSVLQLVNLWVLKRKGKKIAEYWPGLLGRFSSLGKITVILLVATGLPLGWNYVRTWNGLLGTGYGNLLLVKISLLSIALGLAFFNHRAVVRFRQGYDRTTICTQVPYYIEAEAFVLVSILFTAASLSSQPPAIDIPDLTATWRETIEMFRPRVPRMVSPTHEELLAGEAGRTAIIEQVPSRAATDWSDYNHNVSGIFIFLTSLVGMLSYSRKFRWANYWPSGFVVLGVFLFFRSDAETWPLGPIGFWESTFGNGEVFQHRIATLLVFMLGVMELQARLRAKTNSRLPFVFPILCAFGGLILLTHSHVGFQPKTEFLIQVGHTLMGVFAIVLACGRWLELRLAQPIAGISGFVSLVALSQIGVILMFYREPF